MFAIYTLKLLLPSCIDRAVEALCGLRSDGSEREAERLLTGLRMRKSLTARASVLMLLVVVAAVVVAAVVVVVVVSSTPSQSPTK